MGDEVKTKDMLAIDLSKATKHPVTMPAIWLVAIFLAGWMGKPIIMDWGGEIFFTKVEAADHITAVNEKLDRIEQNSTKNAKVMTDHITEFQSTAAFQVLRGLENDLARHKLDKQRTVAWQERTDNLEHMVALAHEYKNCLVNVRPNCHLIQKQIFQ